MDNNILITGGAGFYGSNVIKKLIQTNSSSTIIVIDRDVNSLEKLKSEINQISIVNKVRYYICDIKNKNTITQFFLKYNPTYVFHFAGYNNLNTYLKFPQEAAQNNLLINNIVCELCIENNVKKIFFLSNKTKINHYYFSDILCFLSELLFQSKTKNTKTNFISLRIGRQSRIENDEMFLKFYPNLLIENDCINQIVECIIEMISEINQTIICTYNSQNEVDLNELSQINSKKQIVNQQKEENLYFDILPFTGNLIFSAHNKILINKNELYKLVDSQKIISEIISICQKSNIENDYFLNSVKKIITSSYFHLNHLKVI